MVFFIIKNDLYDLTQGPVYAYADNRVPVSNMEHFCDHYRDFFQLQAMLSLTFSIQSIRHGQKFAY